MNRLNQSTTNRITDPPREAGVLTTGMFARAHIHAAHGEGVSRQRRGFRSLSARLDDGPDEVQRGHSARSRAGSARSTVALADESLRDRRFRSGSLLFYRD